MHDHAATNADSWGLLEWLLYLLHGNGLWRSSWHCSSEDVFALAFRALCFIYMASQYYRYTRQWKRSFDHEPESPTKTHARWLRTVLLWCMWIHLLGSVVFIFIPIYYVMGVMFLVNGIQCHMLCTSNLQRLTHERWRYGELAIETQDSLAHDLETVGEILAKQSHKATIDMVNDTSRTLSEVRDVLEVARVRIDQTRKSKAAQ